MEKVTGTLIDAEWDPNFRIVWGFIYDDERGRFGNGTWIHTSLIETTPKGERPEFIDTLNSRYRVEWK